MRAMIGLLHNSYRRISFKGRLLMLLVMVSAVQAGVAAYTFNQLRAKPVVEQVNATLSGNFRAASPVVLRQLERSSRRLAELGSSSELAAAVRDGNRISIERIISNIGSDGSPMVDVPPVFVTGPTGDVIAGARPEGLLVDVPKVTSTNLVRTADGALLGTVHVPIVISPSFVKDELGAFVKSGSDDAQVFYTDGKQIVRRSGVSQAPKGILAESSKVYEFTMGSKEYRAINGPVLDSNVRLVSALPVSVLRGKQRDSLSKLVGFIVVLFVLTVFESFMITRAVGDALRVFARNARRVADGDLARRIPVIGGDEVADLSSSFNEMAANLDERIQSLVQARAQLRRQVDLFGEALANSTAIGEMLHAVCALSIESTAATLSRFWLFDNETGNFEHASCIGLRPHDREPCGLERAVAVRNATVQSESAPYWLVVPARSGDLITGMLTLVSMDDPFSADDVRIAERMGVQAAVAIDNARMHAQLKLQATRDGLTGLPNHRSLQDTLADMRDDAYRRGMPLGVALLDIDNFKRINDTFGHPVGDEAIKALGKVLQHGIGEMGMAARYGGEEFVVLMPGCDADAACRIADRLREDIAQIEVPLEDGGMLTFTASFGIANTDQNQRMVDNAELLHQADVGLYNAKRTGKNRVSLAGPSTRVVEMGAAERAALASRERGGAGGLGRRAA